MLLQVRRWCRPSGADVQVSQAAIPGAAAHRCHSAWQDARLRYEKLNVMRLKVTLYSRSKACRRYSARRSDTMCTGEECHQDNATDVVESLPQGQRQIGRRQ